MDKQEMDIELIERYLEQGLSTHEISEFESRLQSDDEFKASFEKIKLLIEGIRYSGEKSSIRSKIVHLERTLPDIELGQFGNSSTSRMQLLKIAASFALIMASIWLVRDWIFVPDHEQIFTANFEPYLNTGSGTVRGTNELRTPEQLAYAAYDANNFYEAAERFGNLLAHKDDAAMRLYLGNAWLALGEVELAKQQFITLIENNAGLIIQAKWYLSLCYLKTGETEQAEKILLDLSQNGKSYRSRASKVLKSL